MREVLDLVNATGIGPQGWGGVNTAADVRVEYCRNSAGDQFGFSFAAAYAD
jgi:tartrate dehydratase alpha subunit/fumarate hydratase class I-like protein